MEYRDLGRSNLRVSALCLGCMNFGWRTDEISPSGSAVSDYYDWNVYAKLRETLRPAAFGGNA